MELGQEIRKQRETVGLSIEALGERSGLSANYIGGIEAGKRDPSLSTVLALARGLGVPAGVLLGGVGELSPIAIEVGRLIEMSGPEIQESVVRLLRGALRQTS